METDPSAFDRKQYRFLLETGLARARKFLGRLGSFSELFGFIAVACYVAGLTLGEYVHILAGDPEIVVIQSLFWTTPGLISNFLVLFFVPYLGDSVIDMARTVSPYLANINLQSYLSAFFRSHNQLFFAILFGSAAAFFQIMYLIISPWTDLARLYMVSYWVTLTWAVVTIFATALTYFLISLLFYHCVASGYIVYRIGRSLRKDLGTPEVDSTDLQWLGRQPRSINCLDAERRSNFAAGSCCTCCLVVNSAGNALRGQLRCNIRFAFYFIAQSTQQYQKPGTCRCQNENLGKVSKGHGLSI